MGKTMANRDSIGKINTKMTPRHLDPGEEMGKTMANRDNVGKVNTQITLRHLDSGE